MAAQYSEINQETELAVNQKLVKSENIVNRWLLVVAVIITLSVIVFFAWIFGHNNIYDGDEEWIVSHDVVGTYGDFIGGVIGTLVALYSAYLLVKTLECQISVNSDVMDTNRNIVRTNDTTIYQSFLQIFDNKFHTMFDNYKEVKLAYRYESTR